MRSISYLSTELCSNLVFRFNIHGYISIAIAFSLIVSLQQRKLTNTVVRRKEVRKGGKKECPSAVTRELKRLQLVNDKVNLYQILCEAF